MAKLRQASAAALLALALLTASASEIDIRLERVSLYQLARVVFGELLHEAYVLDGTLVASDEVATVDLRRIQPSAARRVLEDLLRSRGFVIERADGVTVVKRPQKASEADRLFVYRPKYRSVTYLQGAVRSFVPNGRFAGMGAAPSTGPTLAAAAGGTQVSPQSGVTSVVPAQGPVLASQDIFVFEGSQVDIAKVSQLLGELDKPAREVLVRAYVFEVGSTASEGSAVSLALSLLGGRLSGGAQSAPLPYSIGLRLSGIEAAYSVLQSDSRFKVVSSPSLRIRSGEHAKLSVGSEVPVLGAVSMTNSGQPAQSIEYRSSGVILDLRVEALEESIYLVVQQQVSSFVATTTGVNASPTLLKRDLTTNLGLKAGEVAVIGGLDEARDAAASSGLPSPLSFLGARSREQSRSELILLLEATLAE